MINRCIGCHYYDSKENVCTHGSPIFIDNICTDYQDSKFVKQIRAEAYEEFDKALRHTTLMPNWCYQLVREVKKQLLKEQNK